MGNRSGEGVVSGRKQRESWVGASSFRMNMKSKLRWHIFPRSRSTTAHQQALIDVFRSVEESISTPENGLSSTEVLATVRPGLQSIGYEVETGRRVSRPVLFGENDQSLKSYNVDGWHEESKTVLEVEAGQAVENNRFALDVLKALSIQSALNLVIAVPANYYPERLRRDGKPPKKDFDEVAKVLDGLYASGRVILPLDSILLIGY